MAGIASGQQASPAVQDSLEKQIQAVGALLMVACCVAATLCPGIALGSAGAGLWRWLQQPRLWVRLMCAGAASGLFCFMQSAIAVGWLWGNLLANALPGHWIRGVAPEIATRSAAVEVLAGPLVLEVALFARRLMARSLGAQIRRDQSADQRRMRALTGRRQLHSFLPDPHATPKAAAFTHPQGFIRLGTDRETHRPFDLALPREVANHVFLPGVSGAGKTTTLSRLADGVLSNGYGVVIVDCKGCDLGPKARELADRYQVPFFLIDPDDPSSLGYDPCSGDPSAVANKLVGAFSYGPSAEIYKNIAMEAIPLVARGLLAAGEEVTLEALYDACAPRGMARIAARIPDESHQRVRDRLFTLSANEHDRLGHAGYSGLQRRLGALLEGKFGELFRADRTLSWDTALHAPSVTYIALSTLATSEDVELMGRVIAQDLKQACARRLRTLSLGHTCTPVLAIFDEFAALREADQLSDLLRQARQALMPVVVSTQYIPESLDLRKSVLGAGLLICHRVETDDANLLADALGTQTRTELTNQLDFETGYTQKGTTKHVQAYNVHPNALRTFNTGYVAVRSVATNRHAIIQVQGPAT